MKITAAKNDSIIEDFLNDSNYIVLPTGEIRTCISNQGHKTNTWRTKGMTDDNGYKKIRYKGRALKVHRIVFQKFNGPLDVNLVVNHIDGNPSNNSFTNLELVTQSENNIHRYRVLGHPAVIGNKKINQSIADEIRREVAQENKKACDVSKSYGLAKSTISMILNNKIWFKKAS